MLRTKGYFSQIVFSAQYLRWAFDIGKSGGPETDEVRARFLLSEPYVRHRHYSVSLPGPRNSECVSGHM
jgi:hypothetical protein